MTVRELGPADDEALTGFLDRLAVSSVSVLAYHYPFYRDALTSLGLGEPLWLGAWSGQRLEAMLPGFLHRSELGSVYGSLPFFGPNAGVLCADDARAAELHQALLQALLERLSNQPRLLSASIYTPLGFERWELYERWLPDAIHVERVTQTMRLDPPRWPRKVRYDIRRAQREGVSVDGADDQRRVEQVWELYRDNCASRAIPTKPRAVFDALVAQARDRKRVRLYCACHDGRLVAALMTLHSPAVVSYYLPCTREDTRALQASSLLVSVAAEAAADTGARLWNWEASPASNPGVWRFKARWGSDESRYRIYVTPGVPEHELRALGAERLTAAHPWFFIYPFDRL